MLSYARHKCDAIKRNRLVYESEVEHKKMVVLMFSNKYGDVKNSSFRLQEFICFMVPHNNWDSDK